MKREKEREGQTAIVAGGVVLATEAYKGSGTANPAELCSRYCNQLSMSHQTTKCAIALATKTTNTGALAGRSPLSAAAACIYMAGYLMGEVRSPKDIQAVAGVSDSTIRHAYKLMWGEREKLVGGEILGMGADPGRLPKPS